MSDPSGMMTAAYHDRDWMTSLTLPDPGTGATGFTYHWDYPAMPSEGKFTGTVTDFNGAVSSLLQDVWDHPVKAVDAMGHETRLDWADGLPVAFTDAENNPLCQHA